MGWDFSKGGAYSSNDPFVCMVQNASYHTSCLMDSNTLKMYCGIHKRVYTIRVDKSSETGDYDPIWDTVYLSIDGGPEICCGNRCGGRDTLAALYAEDLKEAMTDGMLENKGAA